jgi:putative flippase GtrA
LRKGGSPPARFAALARLYLVKYRELIAYLIAGGLTTLVAFIVYMLYTRLLGMEENLSNILKIPPAMVFAYAVNKLFVFRSRSARGAALWREAAAFFASRGFSLLLEIGSFFFFLDILGLYDLIAFFLTTALVTVTNYVLSKFVVFRKPRDKNVQTSKPVGKAETGE